MKFTKELLLLVMLVVLSFLSATAQDNISHKFKIYETWINLRNQPMGARGVLYEVKDSSVLISSSIFKTDYQSGRFKVSEINYADIDHVSVRRKNSILTGTLIGTAIGLAGAIGIANGISRDKNEFAGVMVIFGTPIIAAGAGIGALAGTLKIRIPIKGSFENFKINEKRLERFSYQHEYYRGLNIYEKRYEHKWFIGYAMNLSVPLSEFEDKSVASPNEHLASTGGSGSFELGYNIRENIGASAAFLDCQYNVKNSTSDKWWDLVSFNAGPLFTLNLREKIFLDLKPVIGYNSATLTVDKTEEKSGGGFGIYPSAGFRYNFSRRWCALAEAGYIYSNLKFEDGKRAIQVINLGVGIGYRFR
jgi:hypothetical protein